MSIESIKQKISAITDGGFNTAFEMRNVLTDITDTLSSTTVTNTSQLTNDGENAINPFISGSSFSEISTGLPNTNPSVDAYRTGKIGLNEPNPQELLDIVGTQSGSTGAMKIDYNWTGGEISRVQIGGQNLLSEIGIPSSVLKGNIIDYFGTGTFANRRAYFANGNFGVINSSLGTFSTSAGVSNILGTDFANMNVFPTSANGGNSFAINIRTQNASGDTGVYAVRQYGLTSGTALEAITESIVTNSDGDSTSIKTTPHYTSMDNLIKLPNYGDGIFISGYTHTDTSGKTGTIATTIGAATYGLAVDTNGNLMEVELSTNVYYGTSETPPDVNSVNEGSIYIQYEE